MLMLEGDAARVKREQRNMVRREFKALVPGRKAELSEVRGPDGSRTRVESGAGVADGVTAEVSGASAETARTLREGPAEDRPARKREPAVKIKTRFELVES